MAKSAANNKNTPAENAMDYPEHEATYDIFLAFSKWSIAFCVFLMAGMAVGFEMGGGFVGGTIIFFIGMIASYFAIQRQPLRMKFIGNAANWLRFFVPNFCFLKCSICG